MERRTATTYALGNRCIKVQTDLNSVGDHALTSLQHYDGLGRVWLSQQIENGSNPSCSDTTSGIKTETRYGQTASARVQLVSNPYRSTSDATAGWTRTAFDTMGRAIQVGHFSGGTAPAWDNNNPDNGKVSMTYDLGDPYSARISIRSRMKRACDGIFMMAWAVCLRFGRSIPEMPLFIRRNMPMTDWTI
jgi:hypothetical protein